MQTYPRAFSSTIFALEQGSCYAKLQKQLALNSSGADLGMMASLFKDNANFSWLSFVIHIIGNVFLGVLDFTSIVKELFFGQDADDPDLTNIQE